MWAGVLYAQVTCSGRRRVSGAAQDVQTAPRPAGRSGRSGRSWLCHARRGLLLCCSAALLTSVAGEGTKSVAVMTREPAESATSPGFLERKPSSGLLASLDHVLHRPPTRAAPHA